MKGFRFYLEYPNTREKSKATRKELGNHTGTVIAVYTDVPVSYNGEHYTACVDAFAALTESPNSPVAFSAISLAYISSNCKYISEKTAREIHPELFKRLDE